MAERFGAAMKIQWCWLPGKNPKFITVGYWFFDKPDNKGTLHFEVSDLHNWKYNLAVAGHEFIEAMYCWIFHVSTETCDSFDEHYEWLYKTKVVSPSVEPGTDKHCPYYVGHMIGMAWEWIVIHFTGASWRKYDDACNKLMEI